MRLRAWLAILVAALGLYFVGRWQGAASVADAAAVENAQTALALGPTYRARLDSLRQRMQQQLGFAQAWRHQADSLRARAVRVDTLVTSDSSALGLWRATANASREEATQCGLALATCQERAQTAEARAQALDSLLGNVLKVKDCKILFVRCPSRIAMFLVGTGLGIVGGAVVAK